MTISSVRAALAAAVALVFCCVPRIGQAATPFSSVRIVGPERPAAIHQFALGELSTAVERLPKSDAQNLRELRIVAGDPGTNREVRRLTSRRLFAKAFARPETRPEGYVLKFDGDKVLIAGSDASGTLYGVMDFIHYHLRGIWTGETKRLEVRDAPRLELRGIWSWGGRIYNYEMFFDQMARWKMNLAIFWHAAVPKNATAIQEYAASRGVKLVWGFSWGWAEGTNWNSPDSIKQTEKIILDSFEKQYASLKPFGIYFQSNTEGGAASGQGEKFVGLVNRAAAQILSKYPNLWISCGVHFSSFTQDYSVLRNIDPRLNIMYEDIASMPFTYGSLYLDPKALEVCPKLAALRGRKEDIGYIFKGFNANCGGEDPQLIKDPAALAKLTEAHPVDPGNERGWRDNLSHALQVLSNLEQSQAKRKAVTLLMEHGMWETRPWYPVCLAAEAMWNPDRPAEAMVKLLDGCDGVVSAGPRNP